MIAVLIVGGIPALYWLFEREHGYSLPRRVLNALGVLILCPAVLLLFSLLLFVGVGAFGGALHGILQGWESWTAARERALRVRLGEPLMRAPRLRWSQAALGAEVSSRIRSVVVTYIGFTRAGSPDPLIALERHTQAAPHEIAMAALPVTGLLGVGTSSRHWN